MRNRKVPKGSIRLPSASAAKRQKGALQKFQRKNDGAFTDEVGEDEDDVVHTTDSTVRAADVDRLALPVHDRHLSPALAFDLD